MVEYVFLKDRQNNVHMNFMSIHDEIEMNFFM